MAFFLGLDAGGTKTDCAVADASGELARRTAGTVKLMAVSQDEATERLTAVVAETLSAASAKPNEVRGCCIGLAGSSSPAVRAWAWEALKAILPDADVLVTGDEEAALEAAFPGGPGMLVIAGTGSHVIGRCSDGMRVSAGGYGPTVGDEGSGYWIGREGIRAGLRALDRGVQSCVLKCVSEQWSSPSLGDLIAQANDRVRPPFADLARVVANCAERGDRIASSVLERAGEELADQVSIVIGKMRAAGCRPTDVQQLAYTGSVLTHMTTVRWSLAERLRLTQPDLRLLRDPVDPVVGALWRARQLAPNETPLSRLRGLRGGLGS